MRVCMCVCLCVCLSVCPRPHAHTIARTRGCKLTEWQGMPPSCAQLGGFGIDARVALLWLHNANRSYRLAFVSDIAAVFVLKNDVKRQPTNQQACLHLAI